MESNMVNDDLFDNKFFLSYQDAKGITQDFLKNNMNEFTLKEDENFGMGFHVYQQSQMKNNCLRSRL